MKIPTCDVHNLACSSQVLNHVGMISVALYARGAPCAYCRPGSKCVARWENSDAGACFHLIGEGLHPYYNPVEYFNSIYHFRNIYIYITRISYINIYDHIFILAAHSCLRSESV